MTEDRTNETDSQSEWISVDYRLPDLDVDVLTTILEPLFTQPGHMHVAHLDYPHHWSGGRRVTHWMPLPPPPMKSK